VKTAKLGELVDAVTTWNPSRNPDVEFEYIDLSAVDNGSKAVVSSTTVTGAEAPSRARQLVSAGDVLVSTVRPNLNAVAVVPAELDGATASTGFTVLRPSEELDGRFLYHWVQSPAFIGDMVRKATGASYPAVSDRIVKDSAIPAPPLPEQRRVAAILDHADALRTKRRHMLTHIDALTQSIFNEMFAGLRATSTVEAESSLIRTGPFGSQLLHSEFVDEGIAVLGLDNVVGNEFRWGERRFITPAKYEKLKRYTVSPGDVLISIMGTTGRCVVVPDDIPTAINTKHICAITPDSTHLDSAFLRAAFLWHPESRAHLMRQTKGSIMDGLNMGIIKAMPIPVPLLSRQREFAARARQVTDARDRVALAGRSDDELFSSLQSRAFCGEL
jgi:type I restriction enzyme S subunit